MEKSILLILIFITFYGFKVYKTESGIPLHWEESPVEFYIGDNFPENINSNEAITEIDESFSIWEKVSCLGIKFIDLGLLKNFFWGYKNDEKNYNLVTFITKKNNWEFDPSFVGMTVLTYSSQTGKIFDADILLNAAYFKYTTSDPPSSDEIFLKNSLVHEIGHLLGLDHSSLSDATMYFDTKPGETKKVTLSNDDINGVCSIYNKYPVSQKNETVETDTLQIIETDADAENNENCDVLSETVLETEETKPDGFEETTCKAPGCNMLFYPPKNYPFFILLFLLLTISLKIATKIK